MEKKDYDSAVILSPHSRTNPSDKYRVTLYIDWMRYCNNAADHYDYVEFETYDEARAAQDDMNTEIHNPYVGD